MAKTTCSTASASICSSSSTDEMSTAASSAQSTHKSCLLKVVVLGDGGVGKTCLISRFVSDKFDPCSFHTIGVEFLNRDVQVNGVRYTLQMRQERFKSLRTPFYRGTDICVLTYAVDDASSFSNLAAWRREFLYYAGVDETDQFPFLVVGNKADVGVDARRIGEDAASAWCAANGNLPHVEASAKEATNVKHAFDMAVHNWLVMEERFDRPFFGETVKLHGQRHRQHHQRQRRRSSEASRVGGQCCGLL